MYAIRIRRGTSTEWLYSNPILLDGEIGYESDTNKFKVGDGVNDWVNRPYGQSGPAGPEGPQGPPGPSVVVKGVVPTFADLPTNAQDGDVYITADTLDGWLRDNSTWTNLGPLQGPQGETGPAGATGATGATGPEGPQGPIGPQGESGLWWSGTQAEYDAIPVKDPDTLYVISG